MLIIPAIDIKGGKCVRLRRGQMSTAKVFSDSPLEIVKLWVSQGAQLIHVIDLDGAKNGLPINDNIIKKIVRSFNEIDFQVGGGIVYDSVPETEFYETIYKAGALMRAIEDAENKLGAH